MAKKRVWPSSVTLSVGTHQGFAALEKAVTDAGGMIEERLYPGITRLPIVAHPETVTFVFVTPFELGLRSPTALFEVVWTYALAHGLGPCPPETALHLLCTPSALPRDDVVVFSRSLSSVVYGMERVLLRVWGRPGNRRLSPVLPDCPLRMPLLMRNSPP